MLYWFELFLSQDERDFYPVLTKGIRVSHKLVPKSFTASAMLPLCKSGATR